MLGYQEDDVAAKELSNVMSQKFEISEKSKQTTVEDLYTVWLCTHMPHVEFFIT